MHQSFVVLLCFLPLIIIFIVVKVYLLMTETKKEINYVTSEAKKPHGPYLGDVFKDIDEKEEEY